jgi:hypothetical protein
MSDCCLSIEIIKEPAPLVEIRQSTAVVEVAAVGPQGPPGPAGSGSGGTFIGALVETDQTIAANIVLSSGKNAVSVGDVAIAAGYSVTVPSGARWVVV